MSRLTFMFISALLTMTNSLAFSLFSEEIIVMAKMCFSTGCTDSRYTYTIKDKKIVEKVEILNDKNKVEYADIKILEDCKVIDIKNWYCHDDVRDVGLKVSVVNGIFYPQPNSLKHMKWKQIK